MNAGVGDAMRSAFGDFYRQSWRLVPVNAALALSGLVILLASSYRPAAVAGLVLLGLPAAALMHCAVALAGGGEIRLVTALHGARAHWRAGLEVASLAAVLALLGLHATAFYAGGSLLGLVLAFTALYVLLLGGLLLLVLLAVRVAEPKRTARECAARVMTLVAPRPAATCALGAALALVNLAGIAAALMPFLTLTIAYSFLAVARFALEEGRG